MTAARQAAERRGRRAEWIAANWLRLRGYEVLAMRQRTGAGEIDIVAKRGATLVFVEVKRRATFEEAAWSVTPAAQKRLARAGRALAGRYLRPGEAWRFDMVLIRPWRLPQHVPGAWVEAET